MEKRNLSSMSRKYLVELSMVRGRGVTQSNKINQVVTGKID